MVKFSVPPDYVRKRRRPGRSLIHLFSWSLAFSWRRVASEEAAVRAKRIFERLRDEYGFTGGITIVKDYVAGWHRAAISSHGPFAVYWIGSTLGLHALSSGGAILQRSSAERVSLPSPMNGM